MSEVTAMIQDVQFVTDAEGRKTAVLLPIEQYEAYQDLLEDLHLGELARASKNEPVRPFSEVVVEMRAAGEIDV
jgi:hypothetical protein